MKKEKWSENQLIKLYNLYTNSKKEKIISEIGKTWCAILCKANKLGLKREILELKNSNTSSWTSEDIEFLKINYFNCDKEILEKNCLAETGVQFNKKHLNLV